MPEVSEQEKYYRQRRRLMIGLLLSAIIIILLIWRGCANSDRSLVVYESINERLQKVINDSAELNKQLQQKISDYQKLDLSYSELTADYVITHAALVSESEKANRLANQVKKAKVDNDTAKYIASCDSLAEESIKKDSNLQIAWRQATLIDSTHKEQIKNLTNQIYILKKGYDSCLSAVVYVKEELPALKPQSKLYINVTGVIDGGIFGVGGGFTLKTKKELMIGGRVMATNMGAIYLLDIGVPLSLKRR